MGIFSNIFGRQFNSNVELDYTIIDIETTGLYPECDGITELAAVKVRNGEIVDSFQTLVNPERPIPCFITAKTHISDDMVAAAPTIREALPRFFDFIGDDKLMGYNIDKFDMPFLKQTTFQELGYEIESDTIDVIKIARRKLANLNSFRLDAVREHLGVSGEGAHRALKDCKDTYAVYMRIVDMPDAKFEYAPRWSQEDELRRQKEMDESILRYEEDCKRAKELSAKIPKTYRPAMKPFIPTHYKERWEYTRQHPFETFASTIMSITGSSSLVPRMAAEEIAYRLGAVVKSSTTRDCDFCVVLSEEAFTKLSAAKNWQAKGSPIRIIGPEEFLKMMDASLQEKPLSAEELSRIAADMARSKAQEEAEAKAAKELAEKEKKHNEMLAKQAKAEKELANYDGERMYISPKMLATWRNEFADLWNQILADDIIEIDELNMMRDWLNRHKRRRDDFIETLNLIDRVAEDGVVDAEEMQLLYTAAMDVLASLQPEGEDAVEAVEASFETDAMKALAEDYLAASNPAAPLLDPIYPESVKMPVCDLTQYVAAWYANGDSEALCELWKYIGNEASAARLVDLIKSPLPEGLTIREDCLAEMWAIVALTMRMSLMQGAKASLQTGSSMMATLLSTTNISMTDDMAAKLAEYARKFVRANKKKDDSDEMLESLVSDAYVAAKGSIDEDDALVSSLRGLPPSFRAMFAQTALGSFDKNGAQIVPYGLSYNERCYGCSERVNKAYANALGVFEVAVPHITAVPKSLNRKALQDIMAARGIPFESQGKREDYLKTIVQYKDLMQDLIGKHAPHMKVISSDYAAVAKSWATRYVRIRPLAAGLISVMLEGIKG